MFFNFKLISSGCFILVLIILVNGSTDVKTDSRAAEDIFKRLYKLERMEQAAAIQALLKLGTESKQSKMVDAIADRVFSVMKKSKDILDNADFLPGISDFPTDENTRDALSNVLENTAFLAEIILRFPDLTQRLLRNNTEWNELFKWSLVFSKSSLLIDNKTGEILNLVNQEMNYTDREPNFVNPYKNSKLDSLEEVEKVKKVKKKKKLPKGPRLSARQYGDL